MKLTSLPEPDGTPQRGGGGRVGGDPGRCDRRHCRGCDDGRRWVMQQIQQFAAKEAAKHEYR